jgi:hypothetical protein
MYQSIDVVLARESPNEAMTVFMDAPCQVASDAGVERLRSVRHDVDPVRAHVAAPRKSVMLSKAKHLGSEETSVWELRDSSPAGSE